MPFRTLRSTLRTPHGAPRCSLAAAGQGWDSLDDADVSLPVITSALDYSAPGHVWPPADAWMPMRRTNAASVAYTAPKSSFFNDLDALAPIDGGAQLGKRVYNPAGWR